MSQNVPITPVILSGGVGSRLWPMSSAEMPKQMLSFIGDETMLQLTALRVQGERFGAPIVVASARHADMIETQLADVAASAEALILEPAARNTAPAIALAAIAASSGRGGLCATLLVMPSDHVVADVAAFHAAIMVALPLVEQGWLVTFGIDPLTPERGYGWIHIGEMIGDGVHRVASFVEKPPKGAAEAMLEAGDHVWNGGIFLFRAGAYLDALEMHAPKIFNATREAMNGATRYGSRIYPQADAFAASPSDSIDYAVMEKAERVAVVPVSMGWSDLGSWDALHELSDRDAQGNVHTSENGGEVIAIDTANCLVRTDGARIAIFGKSDLIVVANGKNILILPRGRSQEVKTLVDAMSP